VSPSAPKTKPARKTRPPSPIRLARAARGVRAEQAAADYLVACGVQVLASNVRVGRLEVDLITREGPVIAIVEVRTRGHGSWQRALDSVDFRKRARLRQAGERLWRDRFSAEPGVERMRFDVAAVTFAPGGEVLIEHVRSAF
jgi:putative endonuclease